MIDVAQAWLALQIFNDASDPHPPPGTGFLVSNNGGYILDNLNEPILYTE